MAELHVQTKETNIWPWIIGAILVALILWFVFWRADADDDIDPLTVDPAAPTAPATTPGTP